MDDLIVVRQEDLDHPANGGVTANCMVARAVKRHYGLKKDVNVDGLHIRIGKTLFGLPSLVSNFISQWDAHWSNPKHVPLPKPFAFKLTKDLLLKGPADPMHKETPHKSNIHEVQPYKQGTLNAK